MSSHTEFQLVLNLRYRLHYSKYNDLYYTAQNCSTVTTYSFAYWCQMKEYSKFPVPTAFQN